MSMIPTSLRSVCFKSCLIDLVLHGPWILYCLTSDQDKSKYQNRTSSKLVCGAPLLTALTSLALNKPDQDVTY